MSNLTIFQKHLLNLTLSKSNIITPYESLRGFLSLGFDFPVALVSSIALPVVYGNSGFLWRNIDVLKIPRGRHPTQLENVKVPVGKEGFTRGGVVKLVEGEYQRSGLEVGRVKRLFDRVHLLGVWVIGAKTEGVGKGSVDRKTLEAFMRGEFFEIVRERRRNRGDILPLWRGGPISPQPIREDLFTRLTTPTKFRDAVFSEKEVERIREEFQSRCIGTHKIKHWTSDILANYIKTNIPESSNAKLAACSTKIFHIVSHFAAYPAIPVNEFALDFQGLVRALAFLTGRIDQVYTNPKTNKPSRWTSQLTRRSEDLISETIFRSLSCSKQGQIPSHKIWFEKPDKDVLDALVMLQPISHDDDTPISKSELRQYADKISSSRVPGSELAICRKSTLELLRFVYAADPANPDIQVMTSVIALNRMDKDKLSQKDLNGMVAGKDAVRIILAALGRIIVGALLTGERREGIVNNAPLPKIPKTLTVEDYFANPQGDIPYHLFATPEIPRTR